MKANLRDSLSLNKLSLAELEQKFEDVFATYPDYTLLEEAYRFAKAAHKGQSRKHDKKAPYILHPLRIIIRMFSIHKIKNRVLLISALLHDTVEDTHVTLQQIEDKFGEKIAYYVRELTRERPADEDAHPNEKYASKVAKFRYYLKSPYKVRQLKVFDLTDNMFDWLQHSEQVTLKKNFPRWLNEAENYYLKLAESLGPVYTEPIKYVVDEMYKLGFKAGSGDFKA